MKQRRYKITVIYASGRREPHGIKNETEANKLILRLKSMPTIQRIEKEEVRQ